jgi:hypothetical protein
LEEVNQELAKRIERERVLTEAGKVTTIFNITIIAVCMALTLLVQIDFVKIAENGEKFTAALIVSLIIFLVVILRRSFLSIDIPE